MTLKKAIEILELNLREAGKQMPPDCREAIRLNLESSKRVQLQRDLAGVITPALLPGETES